MSDIQELKEDMKEVKETVKEAVTVLTDLRLLVASDYAKKNDLETMKADIYKTIGTAGVVMGLVLTAIFGIMQSVKG